MASQSESLIIGALTRALAAPEGLPLIGGKSGLFAANPTGKEAAQECRAKGFLKILRAETRGKVAQETACLAEEGLDFLLQHVNPRPVLEAILVATRAGQSRLDELLACAQKSREILIDLQGQATRAFDHLSKHSGPLINSHSKSEEKNGKHSPDAESEILAHLRSRQESEPLQDCRLTDLFRAAKRNVPSLTIGQFHDILRRLHETRQLYLHPWTGPLYEIPEPTFALLAGHELAYYASLCA